MPIQISHINTDNLSIKNAIEKIARDAQGLQNPSQGGGLYVTAIPTTADLEEGQEVYYIDGATIRKYTKINGVIRYWALT